MKSIQLNSIMGTVTSKKDGSIRFSLTTPELKNEEKAAIMELHGLNIETFLKPLDAPPDEMLNITKDVNVKTPSQRLRAVMYVWWSKQDNQQEKFEAFYERKMESIIDSIKSKITDLEDWRRMKNEKRN